MENQFKDFLGESPQAVIDNWSGFTTNTLSIGKCGVEENWNFIDAFNHKGKPVELYKSKNTHKYILGAWAHEGSKEVFVVITTINILPRPDLEEIMEEPVEMSDADTAHDFRNMGFSKIIYSWFLFRGYTIIIGRTQYGIRKTYKMTTTNDIICDLFDDEHKVFLKNR